MFRIGDLARFKDKYASTEEKSLLMLITKIDKDFYNNSPLTKQSTDRITLLASNGEHFREPEQCLELV